MTSLFFYPYENNTVSRQIKVLERKKKKTQKVRLLNRRRFSCSKMPRSSARQNSITKVVVQDPPQSQWVMITEGNTVFVRFLFFFFPLFFFFFNNIFWASHHEMLDEPKALHNFGQTHCTLWMNDCSFTRRVLNICWSGCMVWWLVPRETAAVSAQVLCTPCKPYTCTPVYSDWYVRSHIRKMHVCLAVTCTFVTMTGIFYVQDIDTIQIQK